MNVHLNVTSDVTRTATVETDLNGVKYVLTIERVEAGGKFKMALYTGSRASGTAWQLPNEPELLVLLIEAALQELDSAAE